MQAQAVPVVFRWILACTTNRRQHGCSLGAAVACMFLLNYVITSLKEDM